jgi:SAM-dependent methyltransferase
MPKWAVSNTRFRIAGFLWMRDSGPESDERVAVAGFKDSSAGLDEAWVLPNTVNAHYDAAAKYATSVIGAGTGKCLVVGSPIFEAEALADLGWDVTHLDVRPQPPCRIHCVRGDLISLPFADNTFAAASSTCVLCHAGLGRYGDRVDPDGDRRGIKELARVLVPGGKLALMLGPCFPSLRRTLVCDTMHRIYKLTEAVSLAEIAGLRFLSLSLWDFETKRWLNEEDIKQHRVKMMNSAPDDVLAYCYLCAAMEKK